MKWILLDANKTLEDEASFRNNREDYFSRMASTIGCETKEIYAYLDYFISLYGGHIWEYHVCFWKGLLQYLGKTASINAVEYVYTAFLDLYEEYITLFSDAEKFIKAYSSSYNLALVANGNERRVARLIKKFDLEKYFKEFIISGESPYKKPDGFMFKYIPLKYNCTPNDIFMVGDRLDTDIVGAKKCGINTVWLRRPSDKKKFSDDLKQYADYKIRSFSTLGDIIERHYLSVFPEHKEIVKSALIVAGGKGSRLGQLGETTQKCMLPVNGKPFLEYIIRNMSSVGCTEIFLCVSHLADQIKGYFGDGSNFGVHITYLEDSYISTYDAMYRNINHLSDTFFYSHANIVFDEILLHRLISEHETFQSNVLAVIHDPSVGHMRITGMEDGSITGISSDKSLMSDNVFLGIGLYRKCDVLENHDGDNCGMTEKFLHPILERGERVRGVEYSGSWTHIETAPDYYRYRDIIID